MIYGKFEPGILDSLWPGVTEKERSKLNVKKILNEIWFREVQHRNDHDNNKLF